MDYSAEVEVALEAAERAGRHLLEHYARFRAIPDAPANISTAADLESQEIVLKLLHQRFPDDALCAEEGTPMLADARRTVPRLWIIDPIDGTRGFARKNGEFSVMVAFVDQGRIVVGVVLEPAKKRLTYAVRGARCWRRDQGNTAATPCRVNATSKLAAATLVQSRPRQSPTPQVKALGPAHVIETYSAGIKLALVARGEADLYVNNYDAFHDWDICAGHILVEEAGGTVTDLAGRELLYGQPGAWQRKGLLASNGPLHEQAIQALQAGQPPGPS